MSTTLVSSSSCVQDDHQRQNRIMLHPNRHTPLKQAARNSKLSSSDNSKMKKAIITPPPTPQLLLEGDVHISSDGKSHTYYRLLSSSNKEDSLLLEEVYDIENARKDITLLQQTTADNDDEASCQEVIVSFPLQEINHGIQNGAGTGSITWDSSIVMGLYFGLQPETLYGNDVVELGSGVGLGGLLTYYASSTNMKNKNKGSNGGGVDRMSSLTLTEINQDVIDMLRYNTAAASKATTVAARHHPRHQQLHIEQMDWFDFLGNKGQKNGHDKEKKYDTIIASDCIYLPSQSKPLSETIVKLLRTEKGQDDHHHHHAQQNQEEQQQQQQQQQQQAMAHIFSPYNRGCVQDLIHELQEEKKMAVNIETLELSKFRVKSSSFSSDDGDLAMSRLNDWLVGNDDDYNMMSSKSKRTSNSLGTTSKFVHITVTLPPSVAASNNHIMLDID